MSRKPSALGSGELDEMCPVCKTVRYLNRDMEFLINPVCYHPMCSNCVVRIFGDGPNQCPYAGCRETLRKPGFRKPFFGDLETEREVDIRRRVAAVFNQAEDDFETLRDYNDYLQMVEDLTFDLVYSQDQAKKAQAEATLSQWEAEHKADIERNKKAGREADDAARRRLAAEREAARQRRLEAAREEQEEKLQRARSQEEALENLARGNAGAAAPATKVQLKRRGQQPRPGAQVPLPTDADEVTGAAGKLSIRGLKEKKKAPENTGPYDPYAGLDFRPDRYRIRKAIPDDRLNDFARNPDIVVGGYDVREFYMRSMFDAFSGLGVFIDDEKETGGLDMSSREIADFGAGMAAEQRGPVVAPSIKMELDDLCVEAVQI